MAEEMLTKEELAGFLKIGPRTIDRLRKEGLPYIKVGSAVRFEKSKVLDWLEKNVKE
jgi:excisionase family DNA binding protein